MSNKEHRTIKIVLTGPESSGKTSAAEALAQRLNTPVVPEFARYFISNLGRPYHRADLEAVARGQYAWEQWFLAPLPSLLICDTDWTVLHIWEQYRFNEARSSGLFWQKGYRNPLPADLYLLCSPDFPWAPDPLREHPEECGILFGRYEQLLRETGAPYTILTGSCEKRIETALARIEKLC
ncbi:MAG: ATP-binding protein [Saprospiraceae bacterium]